MSENKVLRFEDHCSSSTHWLVTVTYATNDRFGRVYADRETAEEFVAQQQKSPVVKSARIQRLS